MAPAATVPETADHATPLPALGTFETTPAYAAIRDGLAAYLAGAGYIAEHPLLYVDETEDPYVYVRFYLSEDGLGFRDRTYVFSPGVAQKLHEIYEAYDIFTRRDPNAFHASETHMGERPVHAHLDTLQTFQTEDYIEAADAFFNAPARARAVRKPKGHARRAFIRLAACQRRLLRGGCCGRPKFGRPPAPYELGFRGPRFRSMPVVRARDEDYWTHDEFAWRAGSEAAAANIEIWREYIAPRLVHASWKRGAGIRLKSWQSSVWRGVGGDGKLGDEWNMHDRPYWSMKMNYYSRHSHEDNEYRQKFDDAKETLFDEFEHLSDRLEDAVRAWRAREVKNTQAITAESERRRMVFAALDDPTVAKAAWLFRRQAAIFAYREDVGPGPHWRREMRKYGNGADHTAEQIICAELFVVP